MKIQSRSNNDNQLQNNGNQANNFFYEITNLF